MRPLIKRRGVVDVRRPSDSCLIKKGRDGDGMEKKKSLDIWALEQKLDARSRPFKGSPSPLPFVGNFVGTILPDSLTYSTREFLTSSPTGGESIVSFRPTHPFINEFSRGTRVARREGENGG